MFFKVKYQSYMYVFYIKAKYNHQTLVKVFESGAVGGFTMIKMDVYACILNDIVKNMLYKLKEREAFIKQKYSYIESSEGAFVK